MNIVIKEKDGRFSLWVTEHGRDDEPPILSARDRTIEQVTELARVVLAQGAPTPSQEPARAPKDSELAAAKRAALQAVLTALDGWIEDAQANHGAMDHRYENRGEECWKSFAPSDFRNMVNSAAEEVGVKTFPEPSKAKEDEIELS